MLQRLRLRLRALLYKRKIERDEIGESPIYGAHKLRWFGTDQRTMPRYARRASTSSYLPDVFETLLDFLRTGSTANLPARVTLPVPKFDEPDFPPPPPPRESSAMRDRRLTCHLEHSLSCIGNMANA